MKSEEVREGAFRSPTSFLRTAPSRLPLPHQREGDGDEVLGCRLPDMSPGKSPPAHPISARVWEGRVSPPFRWQAGKVWQGVGSAVRLPPRSPPWWILASRPSAPWLLTGIPDAMGPLSSRSTLAGPSVLPFQARALSSTSAGMTRRAQCLYVGGVSLFPQLQTLQHVWVTSNYPLAGHSWEGRGPLSHHRSTFTHRRDPGIATFHCNHWYDSWQRDLPYPSFSFQTPTPQIGL